MFIQRSDLFYAYLAGRNAEEGDLREFHQKSYSNWNILLGNILFVGWRPYLVALAISTFASAWFGWPWFWTAILGLIGGVSVGWFIFMEISLDDQSQPKTSDGSEVSIAEYRSLLSRFCQIFEAEEAVVNALSNDDLRSLASEKLREVADQIRAFEEKGDSTQAGYTRNGFRENHALFFKLGLVRPRWDHYFKKESLA